MVRGDESPLLGLSKRLGVHLAEVGRYLAPAARLARLDTAVLRAWARNVRAVEQALGVVAGIAVLWVLYGSA